MLSMVAGLTEPSDGDVVLDGRETFGLLALVGSVIAIFAAMLAWSGWSRGFGTGSRTASRSDDASQIAAQIDAEAPGARLRACDQPPHLPAVDLYSRQPSYKHCAVRLERIDGLR